MHKSLIIILVSSSVILAQSPKVYLNMSPIWSSYESKGITSEFKPTGFKWTAGYVVKEFSYASLALEGSAILGVNNDKKSTVQNSSGETFNTAQVSIDKMYSLNVKSMFPLTQSFNANLYVGGTRGKVFSSSDESTSKGAFESSISYGAGLEYWTPVDVSLYANYMQYFKNLDAIEVGVGFRF
ncbi:MAG: Unknown protein [uncultured Sulfurovum sp.]|uniref:Outer membrane protein beta-barrel domain-containing protein n=1 Tax=uncultured Sulfurovum sp. TaxID=269237 RepID=A0A6S6RZS1_9BACT|nr:MAG: Unknown protein [uncultured Sulfurovum sp.]